MAEKRKRRNGLLQQLGICPKLSTSEPGIDKGNNKDMSTPHCAVQQDIRTTTTTTTTTRRSLRRKQKFLASIGVPVSSNSENCKASSSTICTVPKSNNVRDKSKENIKPPSDYNSSKLKSKLEQSKVSQRPKTKPKPKKSRSRNEIKAKNPKLIETSVLELTPLKSLKTVPTLGFIEEMSPMSFGTPAAKKKCSRKRDPMELSPTFRSKNYKSVLSKKNSECPEPIPESNGNLSVDKESEELSKECKLQDFLSNRNIDSSEDEEDEYF